MAVDSRREGKFYWSKYKVMANIPDEPYRKLYIGDGVYVSYDGLGVKLETERESNGLNWMVLEPGMCLTLVNFFKANNIIEP